MKARYILKIPARINILGNPTDANEGDYHTISAAISLFAGGIIEPAEKLTFHFLKKGDLDHPVDSETARVGQIAFTPDDKFKLFKAAISRMLRFHRPLKMEMEKTKVRIGIWTEVPRQSGLAGSSIIILLILNALREFYDLPKREFNDYVLAELTQRIEEIDLGVTCGFSDRYVTQMGGLAYLDYRGKLFHKNIFEEPLATYERLNAPIDEMVFIVASSGVVRESGSVHSILRGRYLLEYEKRTTYPDYTSPILDKFDEVAKTAWVGKIHLLRGDLESFGSLMNKNHQLVNEIMLYCGFPDGAGQANNILIKAALDNGALGAKLTGAGGGGSVFALVRPKNEGKVLDAMKQASEKSGLEDARFYRVSIADKGAIVRKVGKRENGAVEDA
jgi:galactokinase/mevalonate kinase-like predicted kinase